MCVCVCLSEGVSDIVGGLTSGSNMSVLAFFMTSIVHSPTLERKMESILHVYYFHTF